MRHPLLGLLLLALPSCGVIERARYRHLPPPDPAVIAADAAGDHGVSPTVTGPWKVDLPTVLRLAKDRSLDIALVREKVREAHAHRTLAEERFLPAVTVGGRFLRHEGLTQETTGGFVEVDKQSAFAGAAVAVDWEVGDAIFANLAASRRADASQSGLKATEQSTALAAGEGYLQLVRAEAELRVADAAQSLSEVVLAETEAKVQAGAGFQGDVLRQKAQLAHDRLHRSSAREQRLAAALRLSAALNLPEHLDLEPAETTPVTLTLISSEMSEGMLVQLALRQRPEFEEAGLNLEAAEADIDGAMFGPLIPRVSADASFGGLGRDLGDLTGSDDYRIMIGWTLGRGGLFDRGRIELAEARQGMASVAMARLRTQIVLEVRQAHAEVQSRAATIATAEQGVKDAERAVELYRKRLQTGIGLPLEVLVAEEALTRARLDWVGAVVGYDVAQLRLLFAIGGRVAPPNAP